MLHEVVSSWSELVSSKLTANEAAQQNECVEREFAADSTTDGEHHVEGSPWLE